MQVRDMKRGKEVLDEILESSERKGKLELIGMELDSFESIRGGVRELLGRSERMNVLVCNAGMYLVFI